MRRRVRALSTRAYRSVFPLCVCIHATELRPNASFVVLGDNDRNDAFFGLFSAGCPKKRGIVVKGELSRSRRNLETISTFAASFHQRTFFNFRLRGESVRSLIDFIFLSCLNDTPPFNLHSTSLRKDRTRNAPGLAKPFSDRNYHIIPSCGRSPRYICIDENATRHVAPIARFCTAGLGFIIRAECNKLHASKRIGGACAEIWENVKATLNRGEQQRRHRHGERVTFARAIPRRNCAQLQRAPAAGRC